jgi:hypothetical protein
MIRVSATHSWKTGVQYDTNNSDPQLENRGAETIRGEHENRGAEKIGGEPGNRGEVNIGIHQQYHHYYRHKPQLATAIQHAIPIHQ